MNSPQAHTGTSSRKNWIVGLILVAVGAAWYLGAKNTMPGEKANEAELERTRIFKQSVVAASSSTSWPKSENELLREFWKCIAAGDYKQATILCPGSKESDYAPYARMKSHGEIEVMTPEPHPTAAGVQLWPIEVMFEGFGKKTIKLAIMTLPDGKLAIDGQHSIWW